VNGTPRVYVTIHKGIGGWNSSVFGWTPCSEIDIEQMEDGLSGFYEPLNTGFTNTSLGTGERDAAIQEARHWAECEDLPIWIPPNDQAQFRA
jgi:hypothetical protein